MIGTVLSIEMLVALIAGEVELWRGRKDDHHPWK